MITAVVNASHPRLLFWNSRAAGPSDFVVAVSFHFRFSTPLLCALAWLARAADLPAWRNQETGARFEAQPVEALGPYALFGPEAKTNRVLKFRALSADDCVRFHRATASRPPRATRWAEAQGSLTRALFGCVQAAANGNHAPADRAELPKPELLLIYFSHVPCAVA